MIRNGGASQTLFSSCCIFQLESVHKHVFWSEREREREIERISMLVYRTARLDDSDSNRVESDIDIIYWNMCPLSQLLLRLFVSLFLPPALHPFFPPPHDWQFSHCITTTPNSYPTSRSWFRRCEEKRLIPKFPMPRVIITSTKTLIASMCNLSTYVAVVTCLSSIVFCVIPRISII